MSERKRQFLQRLENRSEAGVREDLELRRYGGDHIGWAKLWLADLEQERATALTASNEELIRSQAAATSARMQAEAAKESNRIASEANIIAREARDKAQTANVIATLAMIFAIIVGIISAITSLASNRATCHEQRLHPCLPAPVPL